MNTPDSRTSIRPPGSNLYARGTLGRMILVLREKGLRFMVRKTAAVICRAVYAHTLLPYRRRRTFVFRGETYDQLAHPYNFTWANERAVEIPVALRELERRPRARVLEVGNVLSHYVTPEWDVLDKFEPVPGSISGDAVDFRPDRPYDVILSISTIEHVGWDDDVKDPQRAVLAVRNLRDRCLAPGGFMLVTLPLGYNPCLDERLFAGDLGFDEVRYLKKPASGRWEEVDRAGLGEYSYGTRWIEAAAVAFGTYTKPRDDGSEPL